MLPAQPLQDTQLLPTQAAAQSQKSPTVSNSRSQAQGQQVPTPAQLRLSFSPSGVPCMQLRRPGMSSSSRREQGPTSASLATAAAAQEAVLEAPQPGLQQEATPGSLTFKVAGSKGSSSSKRSTPGLMPTPLPQRGRQDCSTLGVAQPSIKDGRPTSALEGPDLARAVSLGEQMSGSKAHVHPQTAAQVLASTPGGCSDLTTPGTGDCCFGSGSSRGLDSSRRPGSRGSATNGPGTNLCKNPAFDAGEPVS